MRDAFVVLSCPFWCTVLLCGALLLECNIECNMLLECNIEHRRSATVLCMLYKIGCNPMYSLYCAIPVPYVPVPVNLGALVTHRYILMSLLDRCESRCAVGPYFGDPVFTL